MKAGGRELLHTAIQSLAAWVDAVGWETGCDYWDDWYKDALYRPHPLRDFIKAGLENIRKDKELVK